MYSYYTKYYLTRCYNSCTTAPSTAATEKYNNKKHSRSSPCRGRIFFSSFNLFVSSPTYLTYSSLNSSFDNSYGVVQKKTKKTCFAVLGHFFLVFCFKTCFQTFVCFLTLSRKTPVDRDGSAKLRILEPSTLEFAHATICGSSILLPFVDRLCIV